MIERGSYRVKGASGVFTMRERGQEFGGLKSPSKVQGQSPGRESGDKVPQKLKLFC